MINLLTVPMSLLLVISLIGLPVSIVMTLAIKDDYRRFQSAKLTLIFLLVLISIFWISFIALLSTNS